jgi:hypothetical protein
VRQGTSSRWKNINLPVLRLHLTQGIESGLIKLERFVQHALKHTRGA